METDPGSAHLSKLVTVNSFFIVNKMIDLRKALIRHFMTRSHF